MRATLLTLLTLVLAGLGPSSALPTASTNSLDFDEALVPIS
jgi:hypothetical protein